MDLEGAKATRVLPLRAPWRPAYFRLAIAALWTFALVGCVLALGGMFAERTLPDATFASFGGWQLYAMGAGFGLVLLALLVSSVAVLQRRIRAQHPRLAYQRAVVLGTFVPGLFLGALLGDPMSSAISWASNQTASAANAKVEADQLLADNRAGPPALDSGKPAAPSGISAHLLRADDIGGGWYDGQRPAVAKESVPATAGMFGATLAVKAMFQQAHWNANAWLPQQIVVENMTRFRTVDGARRYLRSAAAHASASHLDGITVYERGLTAVSPVRLAEFLVGADVFSVSITVTASGSPTPAKFRALVATAVQRAT